MGAFFLFRSSSVVDLPNVRGVFAKKGFSEPQILICGHFTLWHFRKQLMDEDGSYQDVDGSGIFVMGTVTYRGANYRDSLQGILEDHKRHRLQISEMRGNYCVLICHDERVFVLLDPLGIQHIFTDDAGTRFSTSFLAALVSFGCRKKVNTAGFLEKLCTGYILAPDTLVRGILRITPRFATRFNGKGIEFSSIRVETRSSSASRASFQECVEHHHSLLECYFAQIAPMARQYGVDLGLSDGYDSRLILAHLVNCGVPFSVHTHHTGGNASGHEASLAIVQLLAKDIGARLRVHDTKDMKALCEEERARDMLDGLFFYDARCGDNSGAFSQIYTHKYKSLTYGEHRMRLNGEGGEIYRNYFTSCRKRVHLPSWLWSRVYPVYSRQCLRSEGSWSEVESIITAKLSERLGVDCAGEVDWDVTRRFYGEVWLPECEGVIANADGQLAHFLMPFAEPELIRSAYDVGRFVGVGGRFEAALITRANPTLATRPCRCGFPLHRESIAFKLVHASKGYAPDWLCWWWKGGRPAARRQAQAELGAYQALRAESRIVRESEEALRAFVPEVEPDLLMSVSCTRRTALFLGCFLREFSSCLVRG